MLDHLKALLVVAGGVVGVGVGAITLALRQSNQHGISTTGGGESALTSSSSTEEAQETTSLGSTELEQQSLQAETESHTETTTPSPQVPAVKEEEKENCKVIDFPTLNDVFENIIENNAYTLVSCTKTNKDIDTNNKFPNKWKGLFPSDLLENKVKEFKLSIETTGSGENVQTVFSSELLSSPITGKWSDIFQDSEVTFRVQQIGFKEPKSGKIFLFLIEKIDSLIQKS